MNLLQMSFCGAILIAAIIVVRAVLIHKLPKKTFLILWGIVLLRLLIPFSIPSVLSAYSIINRSISRADLYADPRETDNEMPVSGVAVAVPAGQLSAGGNTVQTQALQGNMQKNMQRNMQSSIQRNIRRSMQLNNMVQPSAGRYLESLLLKISLTWGTLCVWNVIWGVGAIACAAFFVISYLHWRFEFKISFPVSNTFIAQWLEERQLKRPVTIRQSGRIAAPLTYGVFHPVILMPQKTEWENRQQLQYILLHEYVHICRYDMVTKLIFAFALCIHWFNPMVWIMYLLFNRDIELVCDECVIRKLGEDSKSAYARTLISMEEKQSGLMPLCNNFSKNAIEERITSVMKIKKTSFAAAIAATVVVTSVTTVFATSAVAEEKPATAFAASAVAEDEQVTTMPIADFSEEEYEMLHALQFDGYEYMSVSEYQNKVWELTDTAAYRNLLERFSKNEKLYKMKDSNETADFLFYLLEPLTAERWQSREFGGYAAANYSGVSDNAVLEYIITLEILDADRLTVGEYNAARQHAMQDLENMIKNRTTNELRDAALMQEVIDKEIHGIQEAWEAGRLNIAVEYAFVPLSGELAADDMEEWSVLRQHAADEWMNTQETREYAHGTEEDYESLLALKTPGYADMSVADFNKALLKWANEDYERMERINIDTGWNDFQVSLNQEESSFVKLTVYLSGTENAKYVQSSYTGGAEEEAGYNQSLPEKTAERNGMAAWCSLWYQFSYSITDKNMLTVGERDDCVEGMTREIEAFWNETDTEEMLKMTKEDVVKKLQSIAEEYSSSRIIITIHENQVQFESMDERNIR